MRRRPAFVLVPGLLAVLLAACSSGPARPVAAPALATSRPAPTAGLSGPASPATSPAATPPASTSPASTSPASTSRPARLAFAPCGQGFSCATLQVPLDADPADGTVGLAVLRRPATDRAARLGALVVNPGGPGASAVDYLRAAWTTLPVQLQRRFDLVAVDPRGVGHSAPVRCATTAQLDAYFHLDPEPDTPAELAQYERGNAALARGCAQRSGRLLPHLSTADAADDLDRLRAALGEPRLTYLGYSYGTAIGAAYLDRYAGSVRAMVLDGALDPALTWNALLAGQSTGFDVAFRAFLDNCQRTDCAFRRAVRGDLGAAYDALAARVDRRSLPGDGTRTVGPGEFSLGVLSGLYSRTYGWPQLAQALTAAEGGAGAPLLALSDSYLERGPNGYSNVSEANLAVNCVDRPWPRTVQPYLALAERVRRDAPRFGPSIALSGLACASWPVPPQGTPHAVRAVGAPPVVVIGTTRDPATPYAWAVALARQLSSGVLVSHDGDGHTVYRVGGPPCVVEPVTAYLLTATSPGTVRC